MNRKATSIQFEKNSLLHISSVFGPSTADTDLFRKERTVYLMNKSTMNDWRIWLVIAGADVR